MTRIRLPALLCVAVLAASACGGAPSAQDDPRRALSDALEAVGDYPGIEVAVSLDSTPESLQALAASDDGQLTEADAEKILDSQVVVAGTEGEDPEGTADDEASVTVVVAGTEAVELRSVDETVYVRADVRGLLEAVGQDPAAADMVAAQSTQPGLEFLRPAVEGEWLRLDGAKALLEQQAQTTPAEPTEEQRAALEDFVRTLREDSTVTYAGDEEQGEHLVASVGLRDLYTSLQDLGDRLGPGATGGQELPGAQEVPNLQVDIDTWVSDGRLSRMELDLTQFTELAPESEFPRDVDELALAVDVDEFSESVEAPDDAVPVDVQQLFSTYMGDSDL
ncbi:hypothetical protein BH20ACT9_BH20ACT9_16940 [soil metagenome]